MTNNRRPWFPLALFVAFFLVHCYPNAPRYIQTAKAATIQLRKEHPRLLMPAAWKHMEIEAGIKEEMLESPVEMSKWVTPITLWSEAKAVLKMPNFGNPLLNGTAPGPKSKE